MSVQVASVVNGDVCTCCWGRGGGAVELESACYRFLSFDVLRQVELNNPLETFRFKDVDDYADDV